MRCDSRLLQLDAQLSYSAAQPDFGGILAGIHDGGDGPQPKALAMLQFEDQALAAGKRIQRARNLVCNFARQQAAFRIGDSGAVHSVAAGVFTISVAEVSVKILASHAPLA